MKRRSRLSWPSMDAWVQALLMTWAVAMTAIIVMNPDVMSLIT